MIVLSSVVFVGGLLYPERQPLVSILALGFLAIPVAVRLRFVPLVKWMKASGTTTEGIRFPFYTCDRLGDGGDWCRLEARHGWAELSQKGVKLWTSKSRDPLTIGTPIAVSAFSPHELLYDQLMIETGEGRFCFQVIRQSGTALALAGSVAVAELASEARASL